MPTREQVETAARALRRAGDRVSVRNVRRLLPKGGSYSSIGPLLATWKLDADYRPGKLPPAAPAGLGRAVDAFVAQVWAAATAEAEKVVLRERRRLDERERIFEREAVAAWAEVDRLNEEVSRLEGEVRRLRLQVPRAPSSASSPAEKVCQETPEEAAQFERMRGFIGSLPGNWLARADGSGNRRAPPPSDAEMEALLQPLEARWAAERDADAARSREERFWDGVMEEAAAVLRASSEGVLGTAEILAGLGPDVVAAAEVFGGLDEDVLCRKLRLAVGDDKLFRLLRNDRYGLSGDDGSPGRRGGRGSGPAQGSGRTGSSRR
ncbi:DNA-binding protein [Enterovirga sp. DB1703]|uniref:DNA-binding protein n=2 Tax=Enterovirga aerilata TaxID=2730920 RepID=A0A849I227_9HYPH|nr:DNA-binding protein [Enterovirga sp. DB1703]NNM73856.1 DNA-binding protein [Enterovirga sp. DB1703]